MNIRTHKGAKMTGGLGAVVIIAHLVAAIGFGMAAAQWMSGAAIGLVLLVGAFIHVARANHGKRPTLKRHSVS